MDRTDRTPAAQPPWEALEALAAGELPPDEARRLRERLAIEPGWQKAWREVESVEDLLQAEPLLALPLALMQDTMARILPFERVTPVRAFVRVAAAVLVFCASWFAFAGSTPAIADVGPRPEMTIEVPTLAPPVPAVLTTDGSAWASVALLTGGMLLVLFGVLLALHWNRRSLETGPLGTGPVEMGP